MQCSRVIRVLCILLLLGVVSACADSWKPMVGPPWARDLLEATPTGPMEFKVGWRHGCETGISANANQYAKTFYKFHQDYRMARDSKYYTGWRLGWMYCQRYVFQYYKRDHF
jgi:hypothetical protein